jgi:broad specificity phosphatase PhoE
MRALTGAPGASPVIHAASPLTSQKTFTLLRHGQSTWNARNLIQGSSNFSELSEKGQHQAQRAGSHLQSLGWSDSFDAVWSSPLTRARQTAACVLPFLARSPSITVSDALREIDLYSFQGIDKSDVPEEFRDAYASWKDNPADFEIDGHAPVRELWDRAAAAWQELRAADGNDVLVVAHNATNQALLCTALGLPASMFRKVLQSNAAVSRVSLGPGDRVIVRCINRSPDIGDIPITPMGADALVLSCGELRVDSTTREEKFRHASIVEADAATCDAMIKERLIVPGRGGGIAEAVSFQSDEGGLTVFANDSLLCFNSLK